MPLTTLYSLKAELSYFFLSTVDRELQLFVLLEYHRMLIVFEKFLSFYRFFDSKTRTNNQNLYYLKKKKFTVVLKRLVRHVPQLIIILYSKLTITVLLHDIFSLHLYLLILVIPFLCVRSSDVDPETFQEGGIGGSNHTTYCR